MDDSGWNSDDDTYGSAVIISQAPIKQNHYKPANAGRRRNANDMSFSIPSCHVGKIIGRGGSKIKELQANSGARIFVTKSEDIIDSSVVCLSGSENAKAKARSLIEEMIQHIEKEAAPVLYSYSPANQEPEVEEDYEPIDWKALYERSAREEQARWAALPPILKDFYQENPEVAEMCEEDVMRWRNENNNIMVNHIPDDTSVAVPKIPNPVQRFEQVFSTENVLLELISAQGFTKPSPIQSQAWPILLSGHDLIGIAQTGTGKTLAFLLPAFIHIDNQPTPLEERNGPNVLILAPTRELALQIDKEVKKFNYKNYKSVCIYGGVSRSEQIGIVEKGVQIVIATPGRLNDLVKAGHVKMETVTYLVLDEADRMLDMGFGPQINVSLLYIRPTRQTVMTSATWPSAVQQLAKSYMRSPMQVVVGTMDLAAVHTVTQEILFTNDDVSEKLAILLDFLKDMTSNDKVIVFCGRKTTASHLSSELALKGIWYQAIYGGLEQYDREQALEDMKNGVVNILVATDVASRGIDIPDVTHIINFDFPHSLEEFVHRVGRTGRAGRSGKAITYVTRSDWSKAQGLINILEEAHQEIPPELISMAERFKNKRQEQSDRGNYSRGGGRGGRRRDFY